MLSYIDNAHTVSVSILRCPPGGALPGEGACHAFIHRHAHAAFDHLLPTHPAISCRRSHDLTQLTDNPTVPCQKLCTSHTYAHTHTNFLCSSIFDHPI